MYEREVNVSRDERKDSSISKVRERREQSKIWGRERETRLDSLDCS